MDETDLPNSGLQREGPCEWQEQGGLTKIALSYSAQKMAQA